MRVVFARHEPQGKEYLFKVPNHIKKIDVYDILAVNTMRGLELAEATTSIQDCSDLEWEETHIPAIVPVSNEVAWGDMPPEMREYIKSLPEYNEKIFNKIIGK